MTVRLPAGVVTMSPCASAAGGEDYFPGRRHVLDDERDVPEPRAVGYRRWGVGELVIGEDFERRAVIAVAREPQVDAP